MRTKFVAAAVAAFMLSSLVAVAPASAIGEEIVVSWGGVSYPTGVSSDCARTGTGVGGVNAHHSLVPDNYEPSDEDVVGADMTTAECAEAIFTFLRLHARLIIEEGLSGNLST